MPAYNAEKYIARAIQSVLNQKIQDYELIIIDDGSKDKTVKITNSFDDDRIHIYSQKNEGVSAARNKGITKSKGDLLAFLDSDDEWSPDFLSTICFLYLEYPNAGAYATAYTTYLKDGIKSASRIKEIPSSTHFIIPRYFLSEAIGNPPITSSSVAIKKEVFEHVGTFLEGERWGEDIEMWGRIALEYPIAFYNKSMVYRYAPNLFKYIHCYHPFITTFEDKITNNEVPSDVYEDVLESIANKKILSAIKMMECGDKDRAREILLDCHTKRFKKKKTLFYVLSYLPLKIYYFIGYKVYIKLRNAGILPYGL